MAESSDGSIPCPRDGAPIWDTCGECGLPRREALGSKQAQGFWNGEPCKVERAVVIVADSEASRFWGRRFVGQERKVVLVNYRGSIFAIDDEGYKMTEEEAEVLRSFNRHAKGGENVGYPGWGWDKVTKYHGGPSVPHASVPFERIVSTEQDDRV